MKQNILIKMKVIHTQQLTQEQNGDKKSIGNETVSHDENGTDECSVVVETSDQ